MVTFADPLYLLLLLPVAAAWIAARRARAPGLTFPADPLTRGLPGTWRLYAARSLPFVFLVGLVLSILALARPQMRHTVVHRPVDAIAIEMVLDISGSMDTPFHRAGNFASPPSTPTRLAAAKKTFRHFVEQRPSDLMGMITFGGYAVTRAPLTLDHEALLDVLDRVNIPGREPRDKGWTLDPEAALTALGDGLAMACARLTQAQPKTRVVILLSDGGQTPGIGALSPRQAVLAARRLGIRVYTVGMRGTAGSSDDTTPADDLLDEALLRAVAEATGGRYWQVRDPQALRRALNDIDRRETTPIREVIHVESHEVFAPVLGAGCFLIALACCFNVLWRGRLF